MVIVGLVFAALAALVHVYIFWLESLVWTGDRARRTFRLTSDEARTTQPLAFNQGFYNLFLAVAAVLGIVLFAVGATTAGATLIYVGTGSMVAAALVLVLSNRAQARAALVQGAFPLLALITLTWGLAL
jgi:putative membrane protein